MPSVREELLTYYERELAYIRQMGAEFAQKYPRLAGSLLLEPDRCEDPHVERLMEGFALLAARVHLKLSDDFSEISTALLEILYPHYTRPIPSMSVVEFQLDPEQGKLTTGLKIPRGSVLQSNRINGIQCKFRTAYETTVWPLKVSEAIWRSSEELGHHGGSSGAMATLRVTLECFADVFFKALELKSLRFYLSGESTLVNTLYELLFNNCIAITVRDPDQRPPGPGIPLSPSLLRPMGFAEDEAIIPYDRRSFSGYRLLQEYFTFPEKFFFAELSGLEELAKAGFGSRVEISFMMKRFERPERHQILELGVSAKTLRLGCSPAVNLFHQAAEPITVDHTKFEYPVIPDVRRQTTTEVFSVDDVTAQKAQTREFINFQPFYSFRHASAPVQNPAFWHVVRKSSEIRDDLPTQLSLSFVDLTGAHVDPDADVISVRCTCTNGDLPSKLPIGQEEGDFQIEGLTAIEKVVALRRPTPTLRPPLGKATLWNLISHLSLNYLSLAEEGKESLQEILRLYNFSDQPYLRNQIVGIASLTSERHWGLVSSEQGVSLARGTLVKIKLDEEQFAGGGVFLFSSVIERFLGLYASLNSFSQLAVSTAQRTEMLREWPPRAGNTILL
ncbi:MAG TPA: type VI secretion system baseplate subunit TssF [Candidatus Angelobacter sp.]|nr:type VI secretion system baseplate subunit TssF [Candidatus Angelobacter sp.]